MRRPASLDDYLRAPEGACLVERSFAAFAGGGAYGLVVWGRPAIDEARRIVLARAAELAAPAHVLLLDYRLVETIDVEAFELVGAWLGEHRAALARVTSRAALILPAEPYAAATVAGFYQVVPPPYPSQICRSLDEAAAWLGDAVAQVAAQVHELSAAGRSTSSALASLLDRSPRLSLDEAAAALGTSTRTLQRRLRDEGTTFVRVARTAVVQRAKHLLATTDRSIEDIADAVGCSSVQYFSEVFAGEAGVPPSAWRAAARRR